jgi:hypothetical protein
MDIDIDEVLTTTTFLEMLKRHKLHNLLTTISNLYPDKFNKSNIYKELDFLIKNIDRKIIIPKVRIAVHTYSSNHKIKKRKVKLGNELLCSARIWGNIYLKENGNPTNIIDKSTLDDQFKVNDFNKLNMTEFNKKYIIGSRCINRKANNGKYCKLHSKHLIHGDYLDLATNDLCYHFLKDNKLL